MKSEQDLHLYLKSLFPPPSHYMRVETSTESGCPDVSICHLGVEMWVELKYVESGYPILRKEQYAWGMRRSRAGGRVRVIAFDVKSWCFKVYVYPRITILSRGDDRKLDIVSAAEGIIPHGIGETKEWLMRNLFPK